MSAAFGFPLTAPARCHDVLAGPAVILPIRLIGRRGGAHACYRRSFSPSARRRHRVRALYFAPNVTPPSFMSPLIFSGGFVSALTSACFKDCRRLMMPALLSALLGWRRGDFAPAEITARKASA